MELAFSPEQQELVRTVRALRATSPASTGAMRSRSAGARLLLHGHYGYTDELPFERRLRDVIGLEIGDGTAEVMKIVVARELMGRESLPY